MSLYNAAEAMVAAHESASLLLKQLDDGLKAQGPLRRHTRKIQKEIPEHAKVTKEQAYEIDALATEIVDGVRELKTKALRLRGMLDRLGEPPEEPS